METESPTDKQLKLEVERLSPGEKDTYFSVLNKKRTDLVQTGESRNVSLSERQQLIEDIKEGRIESPLKPNNPFPGVNKSKMEREFTRAGEPMKGARDD